MSSFNLQARLAERGQTRQDILEQARVEREARRNAKQRAQCAVTIQRHWRGRQERVQHAQRVRAAEFHGP